MAKNKVSILQIEKIVCDLPIQIPMFSEFDFLQYVKLAQMRIIFKMAIESSFRKTSYCYCFFDNDIQIMITIAGERETEFERELVKCYAV